MTSEDIQKFRAQKKMTQAAFAEWLGYSKHAVVSWENGRNKIPDAVVKRIRADKPSINPTFSLSEFQAMQEAADAENMTLDQWVAKIVKAALILAFGVLALSLLC